jgi:uncharacterized membrane protein
MLRICLSLFILLGLDTLWIGYIAKSAYFKAYGHVLRLEQGELRPVWWAVAIVYFALVAGLNFFVLWDKTSSAWEMIFQAFVFGLVVYAVYDFTCLALFKDWPSCMTVIDTFWGGLLCALTTAGVLGLEKILGLVGK